MDKPPSSLATYLWFLQWLYKVERNWPCLSGRTQGIWSLLVLTLLAFLAAAPATLVMVLNKQTKTFVVATIGTTPIKLTITAKFHHTPAFVFFVIAKGLVSIHNLVMIMADLLRSKACFCLYFGRCMHAWGQLNVALLSGVSNAAAFMAELGKNGNSHARLDKICDKFGAYCDRGAGALVASFLALAFMLLISFLSILKLVNSSSHISHNNN
ncbi:CASP-like protein 1B2 [Hibiscus syriacus]|uniref:CASP-like protein 1B2 n=1 Tax=Hibiscus syriacus TaxID=106335 RepID=UPI001920F50E|nr:CASP-like protein 1B2 [Hibiscus syriacus]